MNSILLGFALLYRLNKPTMESRSRSDACVTSSYLLSTPMKHPTPKTICGLRMSQCSLPSTLLPVPPTPRISLERYDVHPPPFQLPPSIRYASSRPVSVVHHLAEHLYFVMHVLLRKVISKLGSFRDPDPVFDGSSTETQNASLSELPSSV